MRQKAHAVELHSDMAGEFERRYEVLARDPYATTFTYGRKKIEELLDEVISELPSSAVALDAGCGTGYTAARLASRGLKVVGAEPSEGMRARARRLQHDLTMVAGDIEALPFRTASFDLVISIEVVRYLPSPRRALAEIARVLRPGGVAFVTATPRYALNGYALVSAVTSRVKVPTFTRVHTSFLTTASAQKALKEAGFSRAEVQGRFIGPWQVVGRLAPKALPRMLRYFEPWDDRLSDKEFSRDLSNHLVLIGHR